jgi:ABC-2 type transport system permease protein
MSAATDTGESFAAPAASTAQVRPFFWSVKRELWEHRSLYIAPLVAAAVVVIGFIFNAMNLPEGMRLLTELPPERQRAMVSGFYGGIGLAIAVVMAITAWFYSLDALQGERRDRSVLFWKSLPVSDTTAVLSKMFTAAVVAPTIAFAVIVLTQLLILLLATLVVLIGGANPMPLWSNLQMFQLTVALVYSLIVLSLWYAPIYAWLLLVSAWAKRSTFLWAVLPPIGIMLFEKLAFDTSYFRRLLGYRLQDGLETAFLPRHYMRDLGVGNGGDVEAQIQMPRHALQLLDPIGFLSNPYLWVGLAAAAGLIAAAVWMRRYREPI